MQQKYKDCIAIYTDGSKNSKGHVASAFVIPDFKLNFKNRIPDNLTVFTAELTVIKQCLKWLIENEHCENLFGGEKSCYL